MFDGFQISASSIFIPAIAVAGVFIFSLLVYRRTFPSLPVRKRAVFVVLRTFSLAALILLLLNPRISVFTEVVKKPVIVVLVDDSKSMSIEDCGDESRESKAARVARRLKSLVDDASALCYVHTFSSGFSRFPVDPDSIGSASGEGTDIWKAVLEAASKYRGENLNSIVLISDGRVTGGMIEGAGLPDVPVYTIGVGDTLEGPDVSVENVEYPRQSYVGTEEILTAVIREVGMKDSTVTVELLDGEGVIDKKKISFTSGHQKIDVRLRFKARKEGRYLLTVRAVPLESEKFGENNTQSFRISVLKSRIKVLYIDSHPDWNITFLRSIADRSKRFWFDFAVWLPSKGYFDLNTKEQWNFPASLKEIASYDLICFSDDETILRSRENVDLLTGYVRSGGAILFLADEHSPLLDPSSMEAAQSLLPVTRVGNPAMRVSEYYPVKDRSSFSPLASVIMENLDPSSIPPIPFVIEGIGVRSSARVPVYLADGKGRFPFLILQDMDKGVTCFLNGLPLWRWKITTSSGGSFYDSFFGILLQYLTEGRRTRFLDVSTDRTVYRSGEKIRVNVFVQGGVPVGVVEGKLVAIGDGVERLVDRFTFDRGDTGRGELEKVIDPIPPGEYRLLAETRGNNGIEMSASTEISVLPQSIEFFISSRDDEFLGKVADATGGRMIDPSGIEIFLDGLRLQPVVLQRKSVVFLLNSIVPFVLIVVFLSIEWVMRKVWGLV